MFNPHLLARNLLVFCFLLRRQCSTLRFLHRLPHLYTCYRKPLEPSILVQAASFWQDIPFIINQCLVMPLSRKCVAQKANATLLVDQYDVLDRVTLLLSTVVFALLIVPQRSLDRAFGAIMIKKGTSYFTSCSYSCRTVAKRAGSTSRCCKAAESTGRSSVSHLLASD